MLSGSIFIRMTSPAMPSGFVGLLLILIIIPPAFPISMPIRLSAIKNSVSPGSINFLVEEIPSISMAIQHSSVALISMRKLASEISKDGRASWGMRSSEKESPAEDSNAKADSSSEERSAIASKDSGSDSRECVAT